MRMTHVNESRLRILDGYLAALRAGADDVPLNFVVFLVELGLVDGLAIFRHLVDLFRVNIGRQLLCFLAVVAGRQVSRLGRILTQQPRRRLAVGDSSCSFFFCQWHQFTQWPPPSSFGSFTQSR